MSLASALGVAAGLSVFFVLTALLFVLSLRLLLVLLAVLVGAQTLIVGLIGVPVLGGEAAVLVPTGKLFVLLILVLRLRPVGPAQPSASRVSLLAASSALFVVVSAVYAIIPVAGLTGVQAAPTLARLAALQINLVPALLVVAGMRLARHGVHGLELPSFVTSNGVVISIAGVFGWAFVPSHFWVEMLSRASQIGNATLETITLQDGIHTFFFGRAVARAVAPFGSPLSLAFFLSFPLAILLCEPRRTRSQTSALVLISGALLLTQTRVVLLAVVLVAAVFRRGARSLSGRRMTIVGCLTGLLFVGPIARAISNTFTATDPSSANHLNATIADLHILASHPFGVGLGQGGRIGRQLGLGLAGGENLFLVLGNQLGWLGLGAVVAIVAALAWRLISIVRSREVPGDCPDAGSVEANRNFARAVLACLAIYAVGSLTTEHAIAFQSAWLFWLSLGWVLGTAPRDAGGQHSGGRRAKTPRRGLRELAS